MRPLIKLNKLDISVQASKYHYCTPREDFDDINEYAEVEIALFNKDGGWAQPRTEPLLADFNQLTELIEHYETGDTAVGYYVPIELVNNLIEYLKD